MTVNNKKRCRITLHRFLLPICSIAPTEALKAQPYHL